MSVDQDGGLRSSLPNEGHSSFAVSQNARFARRASRPGISSVCNGQNAPAMSGPRSGLEPVGSPSWSTGIAMECHDYGAANSRSLLKAIKAFAIGCLDRDLLHVLGELLHSRDRR